MVSIVILSYNKSKLTTECLESIYTHIPRNEVEVIVVDNASSDDSVEIIKKKFPQVKLIQNDRNAGFAGGCNLGAKHAQGEYILFLNNDAFLSDNPLPAFFMTFQDHKEAGIVGGMLTNHDGSLQRSFGEFYTVPNVAFLLLLVKAENLKDLMLVKRF